MKDCLISLKDILDESVYDIYDVENLNTISLNGMKFKGADGIDTVITQHNHFYTTDIALFGSIAKWAEFDFAAVYGDELPVYIKTLLKSANTTTASLYLELYHNGTFRDVNMYIWRTQKSVHEWVNAIAIPGRVNVAVVDANNAADNEHIKFIICRRDFNRYKIKQCDPYNITESVPYRKQQKMIYEWDKPTGKLYE